MNGIDFQSVTLGLLVVIGVVNVISFFKPELDSKIKFGVSIAVAFAISFVPVELGNVILNHLKDAIAIAFAASGGYKLAQKIGSN